MIETRRAPDCNEESVQLFIYDHDTAEGMPRKEVELDAAQQMKEMEPASPAENEIA